MLMDQHGEEVYADLRQYYGVRPTDLPPREVLALVRQLPADSRFTRATAEDHFQWGRETSVLADIFDMLAVLVTLTAKANAGKKANKVKDPEPYPRPGVKPKKQGKKKSNYLAQAVKGGKVTNPFEDDKKVVPLL